MPQAWNLQAANGSDQDDEWVRSGVDAHVANNLGLAQHRYQQALRLNPRNAVATHNLAIVFAQSPGFLNEALLTIERAELMDGVHGFIKRTWSQLAMEAQQIDVAIAKGREAVKLDPEIISKLNLASILPDAGFAEEAVVLYNEILDKEPTHQPSGTNCCFVQTLTNATPADLLKQRTRFYNTHRFMGKVEAHDNDRTPDRTLRVGYVGGDFKTHSASMIFRNVLWNHSKDIEMYLYSSLPVDAEKDGSTKKFKELAGERWRDISAMNDEEAARLIRRDRIDILVDLAGHTGGGRLTLFTRKPAPVAVTAWGFAHGTGISEIDYFFADPVAVPPEERQHFAEKIIDLPCIITFGDPEEYKLKAVSAAPYKKNDYITFGSYARYEKMSAECLKVFAEIMRRVPDSRMQFKDAAYRRPHAIRRIWDIMEGIEHERLLFSLATNHPDHMLAYQQSDLMLDPWPHGGGVVTAEEIYMGVPVLTLYGKQAAGRSMSSVLTAMGRTDWIAKSPEEYIEKAVAMAENPKALAEARKTLRQELLDSPVVKGYSQAVEAKYREIWKAWCKS